MKHSARQSPSQSKALAGVAGSLVLLVLISGCELNEDVTMATPASTTPCCAGQPGEKSRLEPGLLFIDSTGRAGIDSLRVYARFLAHPAAQREALILEAGFETLFEGRMERYILLTNTPWHLPADTTILLSRNIKRPDINKINAQVRMKLYLVVANTLPGPHVAESYEYHSMEAFWSARGRRFEL